MGKRVQIRAKKTDLNSERICDAYTDERNDIVLEFKKGKVITQIHFTEFSKQLEPLRKN